MNKVHGVQDARKTISTPEGKMTMFHLPALAKMGLKGCENTPFSIKILIENILRNSPDAVSAFELIRRIHKACTSKATPGETQVSFRPSRVMLQDFTGVPCLVDLAALREAVRELGGDAKHVNPQIPCHLVIDHSVQVDVAGRPDAFQKNIEKEFTRNQERYRFLKWGQQAFKNFSVVPPATGIIHQVNLEYLAQGIVTKQQDKETMIYPDSLVGTDSHTTMINGLGIAGWGVGGIEAEAVMLGEAVDLLLPEVVGVRLSGRLPNFVTATDLVLTVTERLRRKGVVGKFVEFFGNGLRSLTVPDRAVIANMAPEYGATMGLFPIDEITIHYYRLSGRAPQTVDLIERYTKEQGMFYSPDDPPANYHDVLDVDLSKIQASLAGPRRPQDRIALADMKNAFKGHLTKPVTQGGAGLSRDAMAQKAELNGQTITHGTVVLASITSCTNTSNPALMIGAGLLARNAVAQGLQVPDFVKTSFAPGSPVVEEFLKASGLLPYLEKLGFHIVGYGCMTCIGNSGPLSEDVSKIIKEKGLISAAVLSGNRNFEGRIHPLIKANYLASPLLVIAYALAGTAAVDLNSEPLGKNGEGRDIFLKDLLPGREEINDAVAQFVRRETFQKRYADVFAGGAEWQGVEAPASDLYPWDAASTYIQPPPFLKGLPREPEAIAPLLGARVLVKAGNSVTTDHISPAGVIAADSPAGRYLTDLGVAFEDFNSYGSRRGNDRVMTRGTFANVRMRNLLMPSSEGAWTVYFLTNERMTIYDAAMLYKKDRVPLIILAGKEYGTGSSRDWAAKGTALLGVRAVIAESFERIHRSNLIGMGILPLQFQPGESADKLGLKGPELFDFPGLGDTIKPGQTLGVTAVCSDGSRKNFNVICRLDTLKEKEYYQNGGILPYVLRKIVSKG